jgi:hypothetical protein
MIFTLPDFINVHRAQHPYLIRRFSEPLRATVLYVRSLDMIFVEKNVIQFAHIDHFSALLALVTSTVKRGVVGSELRPRTNNPFFVALFYVRGNYNETPRNQRHTLDYPRAYVETFAKAPARTPVVFAAGGGG